MMDLKSFKLDELLNRTGLDHREPVQFRQLSNRLLLSLIALVSSVVISSVVVSAPALSVQDERPGRNPFFRDLQVPPEDDSPEYILSGSYSVEAGSRHGVLNIIMLIKQGWHAYSQHELEGQQPTRLQIVTNPQVTLTGPFAPDRLPRIVTDDFGSKTEQFEKQVIWTAPLELASNVDPNDIDIQVQVAGQICSSSSCLEITGARSRVLVKFAGFTESAEAFTTDYVTFSGQLNRSVIQPGTTAEVVFRAKMQPDWHIYRLEEFKRENTTPLPTIIYFTKTSGFKVGTPIPSQEPIQQELGLKNEPFAYFHEDQVEWTIAVSAEEGMQPGKYFLEGRILFQACTKTSCDMPLGLDFAVPVTVGDQSNTRPVSIALAANQRDQKEMLAESKAFWANLRTVQVAAALPWSQLSLYLFFALVAGLILNAMPCVLPVIGLKVMSFMHQAGEKRGRIFLLNMVFSLGLLSVFWILATLSAFFGFGWGDWLTKSLTGSIVITSIVFAFGLSMLGLWEIPIPGLSGASSMSKKSEEEGLLGAFLLGILTTILATPCTGPLLIPAVTITAGQPAWVAYLIFTFIGLGMALPYLLVGLFPSLISWLPRPGAWMSTFKQITGFILMATVVFLLSSFAYEPRNEYLVAMLSLLLVIAFGCWWVGRTSLAAEPIVQYRAWASCLIMIGVGGTLAFTYLGPSHYELDWEPYSATRLAELQSEDRIVFIDFTGPNCLTCLVNETFVLNTRPSKEYFQKHRIVPMRADKGVDPEAVKQKMIELGNPKEAIPFYAAYGPGISDPVTFDGPISYEQVKSALERAMGTGALESSRTK